KPRSPVAFAGGGFFSHLKEKQQLSTVPQIGHDPVRPECLPGCHVSFCWPPGNLLQQTADEELRILLAEAQRQLDDFQHRVQEVVATADRLMRSSRFTEAFRFIETQPDQLQRS